MKHLLVLLSLFLLMNLYPPEAAHASHVAAVDLSLTCMGGNDYKVRFVLYRDCSGIAAPGIINLSFSCVTNTAYSFTLNSVQPISGTGQVVTTPNCPLMPSACNGGIVFGVQEWVYEATMVLPPCVSWRVSWSTCCRNPSNTITDPTSQSVYIEAILNNLNTPSNSNPVFTGKPSVIISTGQTTVIDFGAVDPNGDSLVYSLVTPFNSDNTTFVNWIPPSTATQPFLSVPPISFNSATGQLTCTPTASVISPMAVRVEEWRTINGVPVKIGTIYRDVQINAINSNNSPPVLSGISFNPAGGYNPNDTIFEMTAYVGSTAEFYIYGHDPDVFNAANVGSPEKFSISWNNGPPQASFHVFNQQTDSAYARFWWIPLPVHMNEPKRCFAVTVKDYACPYFETRTYTYCLNLMWNPTGIDDAAPHPAYHLRPNPSAGTLTLYSSQPSIPGTYCQIFNTAGRCVVETTPVEAGVLEKTLSLHHLPDGIYLLKICSEKGSQTQRFILSKK